MPTRHSVGCDGQEGRILRGLRPRQRRDRHFEHVQRDPGSGLHFNLVSFTSPGRSLHSKISAGTGANTSIAMLSKKLNTALNHSILELDLNVASIGMSTSTEAWLLEIVRPLWRRRRWRSRDPCATLGCVGNSHCVRAAHSLRL